MMRIPLQNSRFPSTRALLTDSGVVVITTENPVAAVSFLVRLCDFSPLNRVISPRSMMIGNPTFHSAVFIQAEDYNLKVTRFNFIE